ncbi:MAG: hypothetical protein AAF985_14540 [Bacteroidota bacterium]
MKNKKQTIEQIKKATNQELISALMLKNVKGGRAQLCCPPPYIN